MFNSLCVSLPSVRDITSKRKKSIEKAWNFSEERQNIEFYEELFKTCENSDFITGRKTEWRAFFDWIFNLTNMQKILEGNYKNSNNNGKTKEKESVYIQAAQEDPDEILSNFYQSFRKPNFDTEPIDYKIVEVNNE
jgi:hypothetical protein